MPHSFLKVALSGPVFWVPLPALPLPVRPVYVGFPSVKWGHVPGKEGCRSDCGMTKTHGRGGVLALSTPPAAILPSSCSSCRAPDPRTLTPMLALVFSLWALHCGGISHLVNSCPLPIRGLPWDHDHPPPWLEILRRQENHHHGLPSGASSPFSSLSAVLCRQRKATGVFSCPTQTHLTLPWVPHEPRV